MREFIVSMVSGINFLVLSVNLISAPLSLPFLFMLLPLLLTLSTHHSYHPYLPLSFTPGSIPTSFTNLSHHRLSSNLRTDSTDFTSGPLIHAKFHPHRCNVSPLRGEKPQNRPLSKRNTGRFALRAMLPVIMKKLKRKNGDAQKKRSGRAVDL